MALAAGTRLGVCEIVAVLGAGGMGQVYRARNTKLKRDVALKVMPDIFTADRDRLPAFKARRKFSRRSTIPTVMNWAEELKRKAPRNSTRWRIPGVVQIEAARCIGDRRRARGSGYTGHVRP